MSTLIKQYIRCLLEAEERIVDETTGTSAIAGVMLPLGASTEDYDDMNKKRTKSTKIETETRIGARNTEGKVQNGIRSRSNQKETRRT